MSARETTSGRRPVVFAAALTMGVALSGAAAQAAAFTPPRGCTLDMTVQNRGCTVSQYYRCAADPEGDQHVVYFDAEGPRYHSRIDAETRWLESTQLRSGLRDVLVEDSPDHASLMTLLRDGRDDFDFFTRTETGEILRHTGEDRLTGDRVEIDGVPLDLTSFELITRSLDGTVLIESRGQQFVSREHRRFHGGIETTSDWTGETRSTNDSPVRFSRPGEPGFASTEPLFDCQMQIVQSSTGKAAL